MSQLWEDFTRTYASSHGWFIAQKFYGEKELPDVERLSVIVEIAVAEWTRAGTAGLADLVKARADLRRSVVRASILNPEWWTSPSESRDLGTELLPHRTVLQKVCAARQPGQPAPWFFTPNYDLAIEWSAEALRLKVTNGFSGVHERRFSPHDFDLGYRNTLARGEARFGVYSICLAKLHGSLSWIVDPDGQVIEQPAFHLWPSIKRFIDGEDTDAPNLLILPSAAKYVETVRYPLGEMIRRFSECLALPQTTLITCGYSFSDEHLNRVLVSALQNPTLHAVFLIPEVAGGESGAPVVDPLRSWVRRVLSLGSPRVAVVGGAANAYMESLAALLPDPVVFDEQALKIRRLLREFNEPQGTGIEELPAP